MTQVVSIPNKSREKHFQDLIQLALSHIGDIPQFYEPSYEQKKWFVHKIAPVRSWERWFVSKPERGDNYFSEEQRKQLGLTDEDIAGNGMK